MRKIVVSASSLPAGRNMSAQLEYIERVGNFGADMYHLDVMDGVYTKHKSIDHAYLEQLRGKSTLLFDAHLMVVSPEKVVDKYIKAGANIISVHFEVFEDKEDLIKLLKYIKSKGVMAGANIISVHFEVFEDKEDLIKLLKYIKSKGVMAGLAVDLETNIKKTEPILRYADMVLIMTVKAGKGGQEFQSSALKKVKYVRTLNPDVLIEVDGGINDVTAPQCVRAGADILVSGNYIYSNDTYEAIQHLKGKNG